MWASEVRIGPRSDNLRKVRKDLPGIERRSMMLIPATYIAAASLHAPMYVVLLIEYL